MSDEVYTSNTQTFVIPCIYRLLIHSQSNLEVKHDFLPYTITLILSYNGERDKMITSIDFARANVTIIHPDSERIYVAWLSQMKDHKVVEEQLLTNLESYSIRSTNSLFETIISMQYRIEKQLDEKLLHIKKREMDYLYSTTKELRQQLFKTIPSKNLNSSTINMVENRLGIQLESDNHIIKSLNKL